MLVLKMNAILISLVFLTSACKQNEAVDAEVTAEAAASEELEKASIDSTVDAISQSAFDISLEVGDIDNDLVTDLENALARSDAELEPAPESPEEERPISEIPICPEPAYLQECRSDGEISQQMQVYDRCLIDGTRTVLAGTVRLSYNNRGCSLNGDGHAVRRTHDLFYHHLPSGEVRHSTSARQFNYKRELIGGGEKLKNTEAGWRFAISGVNQDLQNEQGRKIVNVATSTRRSIRLIDQREEGALYVHGGVLVVDHNKAEFTAQYAPRKLKWVSSCACPVSGDLLFRFEGSREESGFVEFHGCGKSILTKRKAGTVRVIEREACLKDNSDEEEEVRPEEPADLEEIDDSIFDEESEEDFDEF